MSTNNTGKTGTHRARTREIVRFRVTVTLKVLFLCLGSRHVLWRSSVLHVPRIKHSRRPKRKQNGRRTLLLSSNMYRAYFTKKRYSNCKRGVARNTTIGVTSISIVLSKHGILRTRQRLEISRYALVKMLHDLLTHTGLDSALL